MNQQIMESARRLVYLLERLSADSHWAHRASGVRGALLRAIYETENSPNTASRDSTELETRLEALIQAGYVILNRAAQEIRTPELQQWLQNYSPTE